MSDKQGTSIKDFVKQSLKENEVSVPDNYKITGKIDFELSVVNNNSTKKGLDLKVVKIDDSFQKKETVQTWANGFRTYNYNFVRQHTTLGMTPAERAGITLKLGQNKWLGLIKEASTNAKV